jgi:hypothetical protein
MVLGYNIRKTPLEIKVISKGKGGPVGFDLGEKVFAIFYRGIGRYRWAARMGNIII